MSSNFAHIVFYVLKNGRTPQQINRIKAYTELMSTIYKILVVDDENNIAELVSLASRVAGFESCTAGNAQETRKAIKDFSPDLIILDVGLPGEDGFSIAERLRRSGNNVPIIFLTARDTTQQKIHGLTVGGDDYVTKPFSIDELMARTKVVLSRRYPQQAENNILVLGDLELDEAGYQVTRANDPIELTRTEFRLLHYLLLNANQVLTRSQILDHVWDYDFGGDASVLETYISYLRRKIDKISPPLLHTVRGVGYVLRIPK